MFAFTLPSLYPEQTTTWLEDFFQFLPKLLVALLLLLLVVQSIRIVNQYERGVVYRLGRVTGAREPGLRLIIPFIDRMDKVGIAVIALELKAQQVITADNVSLSIRAVVYYKVSDPVVAETEVDDYQDAIQLRGQSVLRQVIGASSLENVLAHSATVADSIKSQIEAAATSWGLVVQDVELRDVELPEGMRRAMAAQAEASREAEAKVIAAQGELSSAAVLAQAAALLSPVALRLRELQTIKEIGSENNTVIVMDSHGGETAAQSVAGQIAGQSVHPKQ